MNVVIVEDERLTAERLSALLRKCGADIEVLAVLNSVDHAMMWFKDNSIPDLLFLDIQLNDGTAFDLLKELEHTPPIIFTTAYDEHTLKAFKYNSIDYLLKPVNFEELNKSIEKFKSLDRAHIPGELVDYQKVDRTVNKEFKQRFLVKLGDQFQNILTSDIAFFNHENGMSYLCSFDGKYLPIDYSLDQLDNILNPLDFFRINRQYLLNINAIDEIHTYLNSRLLVRTLPRIEEDVIISRDRVADFKRWMDT